MSKLYEAFLPYRDKYGLNQLQTDGQRGKTSQNGVLFTMEYLICLLEDPDTSSALKAEEVRRIRDAFERLEVNGKGLLCRHPRSTEYDSMDDNGAAIALSGFLEDGYLYDMKVSTEGTGYMFAFRMWDHGQRVACLGPDEGPEVSQSTRTKNQRWFRLASLLSLSWRSPKNYWNCQRPQRFCLTGWYGRSPGFMGLLDLAAVGHTTLFRLACLLIGQFVGAWRPAYDTDARKLPYVAWYFLARRGWFWRTAYSFWCQVLMKRYPRGMMDVYARYYGDKDHPIHRWSKPHFEAE